MANLVYSLIEQTYICTTTTNSGKKSQELASQLTKSITLTNNSIENFERNTEHDSTGINEKTKEYDNLDQEKQKKQIEPQTKITISQKKR